MKMHENDFKVCPIIIFHDKLGDLNIISKYIKKPVLKTLKIQQLLWLKR